MRRPIALAGVSLAAAALVLTATPAFADTAPVAGTAECTAAVNSTTVVHNRQAAVSAAEATVRNDQAAYDTAVGALNVQNDVVAKLTATVGTTLPVGVSIGGVTGLVSQAEVDQAAAAVPARRAAVAAALDTLSADKAKSVTANNNLNAAVRNQTNLLCTGAPAGAPVPAPGFDPHARPVVDQAVIEQGINNLSCTSTTADLGVVDRQIAAREAAGLDVAQVVSDLNAKLATIHCGGDSALTPRVAADTARACGCVNPALVTPPVVEAPVNTGGQFSAGAQTSRAPAVVTTQAVNPLATDGSTATLSGSEVATAPLGSAQTGAE